MSKDEREDVEFGPALPDGRAGTASVDRAAGTTVHVRFPDPHPGPVAP